MPRKARIDAPGALQHIIARGIEKRPIFKNDDDREDFVDRLGRVLMETDTPCYAWALMPNHVHLLLRTGAVPVATVMRRLLTGHAVCFNHRHRRHGHLFQNRYKSILCQEDAYLKQLVAYIHLNPLRGGIVDSLQSLGDYPFTGHAALMGRVDRPWQSVDEVLAMFAGAPSSARPRYEQYVSKSAAAGRRPELTGGGLIRSAGGWRAVRDTRRRGTRLSSDERILGGTDFVARTLAGAGEAFDRRMPLKAAGVDLEAVQAAVCGHLGIEAGDLFGPSRRRQVTRGRALFAYLAVRQLSLSGADVARHLGVDRSSVSRSVQRVPSEPQLMGAVDVLLGRLVSPPAAPRSDGANG